MVRVSSPAKLRPWSELIAKMVMGVVPGLLIIGANVVVRSPLDKCCDPGSLLAPPVNLGKLSYLQLELFCLHLRFFAYSPLVKALIRRTFPLSAKSPNCKQKKRKS